MKKQNNSGFTLIELMVALVLTSLVTMSIYGVYESQNRSYIAQERVTAMQQNIRAALFLMCRQLRMAGYDHTGTAGAGFDNATSDDTLIFTYVADDDGRDNNGDGEVDELGELTTISYDLYDAYDDGDTDIGIQVDGAARRPVAENIEQIEFFYTLMDDSTDPPTVTITTTPPAADVDQIRAVQITVLVRADRPDQEVNNTLTYSTPGGTDWGPFNDGFRRRMMTTAMKCRNAGLGT